MTQQTHAATAIVTGCAALLLGLVPGLLSGLTEGIARFHDSFSPFPQRMPRPDYGAKTGAKLNERFWFAAGGVIFILLGLFANS